MIDRMKKPSNLEDGMLTKLFRKILFDTGIVNNIGTYINSYVRSGGKKSKSQINKIILDEGMSWKSFIFLIFDVLRITKLDIKIKLHHESGEVTEHTMEFESPRHMLTLEKQKQKQLKEKNGPSKAK